MSKNISESFEHYFGGIEDPRVERTKLYPLQNKSPVQFARIG